MSTTGSLFELVNRLAVRSVGRRPRWAVQDATTGPPTSASSGVNISNAVKTSIQIALREDVHRKTTRLSKNYDDFTAAIVTVTIDGNAVATSLDGLTGIDEIQEIVDEINGDGTVSGIVTASVEDENTVLIQGDGEDSYTIAVTDDETADRFVIIHEDADSADLETYVRQAGTADRPLNWTRKTELDLANLDEGGESKTFDTAGLSRIYYRVADVTPAGASVKVSIGPAGSE